MCPWMSSFVKSVAVMAPSRIAKRLWRPSQWSISASCEAWVVTPGIATIAISSIGARASRAFLRSASAAMRTTKQRVPPLLKNP